MAVDDILEGLIGLAAFRIGFLGTTLVLDATGFETIEEDGGSAVVGTSAIEADPSFRDIDAVPMLLLPADLLGTIFRFGGPFFFKAREGRTLVLTLPDCFFLCGTKSGIADEAGC